MFLSCCCFFLNLPVQTGTNICKQRPAAGHYHGLLHGDDLLAVDLPQRADVAFQSGLQRASGLQHRNTQGRAGEQNHLSEHVNTKRHSRERYLEIFIYVFII